MLVHYYHDENSKPTPEQEKMFEALKKVKPKPDEECPELTNKQIREIKRQIKEQKKLREKKVITLRLSVEDIAKAKSLGPGYTTILSKMISNGLKDPEFIKKCL